MVLAPVLVVLWDHVFRRTGRGAAHGGSIAATLLVFSCRCRPNRSAPRCCGCAGTPGMSRASRRRRGRSSGRKLTSSRSTTRACSGLAAGRRLLRLAASASPLDLCRGRRSSAAVRHHRARVIRKSGLVPGAVIFLVLAPTTSLVPLPTGRRGHRRTCRSPRHCADAAVGVALMRSRAARCASASSLLLALF